MIYFLHNVLVGLRKRIFSLIGTVWIRSILRSAGAFVGSGFVSNGFPRLVIHPKSTIEIGSNFRMNNGILFNPIGRNQRCILNVQKDAVLKIGTGVGISSTAIVCNRSVDIGAHVVIGGGVVIYDTDFHSLRYSDRGNRISDVLNAKSAEVKINDHVFIGAHSIILKGVEIGKGAIIGAGSVVSKSIPEGEIWAGNPAVFIRKV